MAANDNTITITGNLTRDPELKFSPKGTAFCNFAIAWNKNLRQPDGTWKSEGHFFEVTAFNDLAEHVAESLSKGHRVTVVGHVEQDKWQNDAGENRSRVTIKADAVSVDLRWATVAITKATKENGASAHDAQLADQMAGSSDGEPF